jgi:hypothetical protein
MAQRPSLEVTRSEIYNDTKSRHFVLLFYLTSTVAPGIKLFAVEIRQLLQHACKACNISAWL